MNFFHNDFIERYPKLLDKQTCDRIISISEEKRIDVGAPSLADGVDRTLKDCCQIIFHFDKCDPVSNYVKTPLRKCLRHYFDKFNKDKVMGWSNIDNTFNIQKYHPNQAYHKLHCENSGYSQLFAQRNLAWMIYLNDVKDGGETYFPLQKRKLRPRQGDLYIWPAYFTHPHKGLISKTQTKYIATGWVKYIDDL